MTSHTFHNTHSNTYERMASSSTLNIAQLYLPTLTPPITSTSSVLDNACGTGIITSLIRATNPDAYILGADLAPGMLEAYAAKGAVEGWPNIQTRVADIKTLDGILDVGFTHVITNFGIGADPKDADSPGKAAKAMWRVCKVGGVVVVTMWKEQHFVKILHAAARRVRPDEKPFSWDIPEEWFTSSFLYQRLVDAGFGKVEVMGVTDRMEAKDADELVGNLMLAKGMFFKDYSEEELALLPGFLKDELEASEDFLEGGWGVGIKTSAWICTAWK